MSRSGTVRLKRAQIGREQSKSCTATEDNSIFVWVCFQQADEDERINDSQRQQFRLYLGKSRQRAECFELNRSKPVFTSQEKPSGWCQTSEILKMNLTLR